MGGNAEKSAARQHGKMPENRQDGDEGAINSAPLRPNAAFGSGSTCAARRVLKAGVLLASLLLHVACASRLPVPERTPGRTETYVAVPMPPPPPRPEHVPERPDKAVWVDGEWNWEGGRYRWTKGAWVIPPDGAKIAPWHVIRRDDGQLFYSPSVWYDASGSQIPAPAALAYGYVREPDAGGPSLPALSDAGALPKGEKSETPE
jgi:hypothetical protein